MITNFENETQPLTPSELKLARLVANIIRNHTKAKPIFSQQLQAEVHWNTAVDINVTQVRLRAIIHYLRCNEKLPIIATSRGYYFTDDVNEIRKQSKSLKERAMSIRMVAAAFDEMETTLMTKSHE